MGFCQRCGEISQLNKCPRCCGRVVESATSGHSEASSRRDPWASRYVDIAFKKPMKKSFVKRMVTTDLCPTTHCYTCGVDLRKYQQPLLNLRKFGPQQCNECHIKEYGKGQCEECDHMVLTTSGPFVQYKRKVWHKSCLKCHYCGILIEDPLVDMVGLPCCDECFVKSGFHNSTSSNSSSLYSLSPRLSESVTDLISNCEAHFSGNTFEPNVQIQLTPSPNFGRSHFIEKRVRAASELSAPDSVNTPKSKPKPVALYRFIKTTPNSIIPNIPLKASKLSTTSRFSFNRAPKHSTIQLPHNAPVVSSRSSSVSPDKSSFTDKPSTFTTIDILNSISSVSSMRQSMVRKVPGSLMAEEMNDSSSVSKIAIPRSSSKSRYPYQWSPKQEPANPCRVTALFDNKKPETYPPASTSINMARTFAQSKFFNNLREKSPCKSRVHYDPNPSKPRYEIPPSDPESVRPKTADSNVAKKSGCYKCSNTIGNSWYSLPGGDTVHPECFICERCNLQFKDGLYINFGGKFYHRKCIPNIQSSAPQSTLPESYNCHKCAKAIGESWLKLTNGSRYHLSCFTCALCRKEFEDGIFVTKDGASYHSECIQLPSCEACQEQIKGPYVTRGSSTYHCRCFLCGICKRVIGAEMPFGETNHLVCCEHCLLSDINLRAQNLGIRETATPLYN